MEATQLSIDFHNESGHSGRQALEQWNTTTWHLGIHPKRRDPQTLTVVSFSGSTYSPRALNAVLYKVYYAK